jgi:hypothetical protein
MIFRNFIGLNRWIFRLLSTLAILLVFMVAMAQSSYARKRVKPPPFEEIAQTWLGWSTDELYLLRLVLLPNGKGVGGYTFLGEEARVFEISSWKYSAGKIEIYPVPPKGESSWVSPLRGSIVGLALKLSSEGKDWKLVFSLRREAEIEKGWEELRLKMARESASSFRAEPRYDQDSAPNGPFLPEGALALSFRKPPRVADRVIHCAETKTSRLSRPTHVPWPDLPEAIRDSAAPASIPDGEKRLSGARKSFPAGSMQQTLAEERLASGKLQVPLEEESESAGDLNEALVEEGVSGEELQQTQAEERGARGRFKKSREPTSDTGGKIQQSLEQARKPFGRERLGGRKIQEPLEEERQSGLRSSNS